MKNVLRITMLVALLPLVALIFTYPCEAQALQNTDFSTDLTGWFVGLGGGSQTNPDVPGTAKWSSSFGGSVLMTANGAPSSVHLVQSTREDLYPGDELVFSFIAKGMRSAQFAAMLGLDGSGGQREAAVEPEDGEQLLVMRISQRQPRGTQLTLSLTTWPGSAVCYLKDISISQR